MRFWGKSSLVEGIVCFRIGGFIVGDGRVAEGVGRFMFWRGVWVLV